MLLSECNNLLDVFCREYRSTRIRRIVNQNCFGLIINSSCCRFKIDFPRTIRLRQTSTFSSHESTHIQIIRLDSKSISLANRHIQRKTWFRYQNRISRITDSRNGKIQRMRASTSKNHIILSNRKRISS
jgi:hypothetical protein